MSFASSGSRWPANHRSALVPLIVVPDLERTATATDGTEFTPEGMRRLLVALADLDLTATFALENSTSVVGKRLAEELTSAGHEIVVLRPGNASTTVPGDDGQWPAEQGIVIGLPGNAVLADDSLAASWVIDGRTGTGPSVLDGSLAKTVHLPTSSFWMDSTWLSPDRPLPPSSLLEHWSVSLADARTIGELMTIVLHPHISGRAGILSQVLRFLDEAVDSGDVWITNAGNVAAWWKQDRSS